MDMIAWMKRHRDTLLEMIQVRSAPQADVNAFYTFKKLGIQAFFITALQKILSVLHLGDSGLYRRLALKYEEILKTFLVENVCKTIDLQYIVSGADTESADVPRIIWVMWWQGLEQAPEVVKMCISQIRKQNKYCDIRIIDKYNYSKYVAVPEIVMAAVQAGTLSLTHLSDIMRVKLLLHHGGVWMDSTLFVTQPLAEDVFRGSFYSIVEKGSSFIPSRGRWTVYFMSSPPNTLLFRFLDSFFNRYLQQYSYFIDYLMLDHTIQIAYDQFPSIRTSIDNIPQNNPLYIALYLALEDPVDREFCENCISNSETTIFKLSYKGHLSAQIDGKETTYGYLIRKYGEDK
ncbi:MAG: capsular polysaccharide synthesis protein [Lachnospiraceae bacterium]|nr:capsular polysaccharide synthesis protein [Lachnospiraceae bacterium]